jgi:hypothetical protein
VCVCERERNERVVVEVGAGVATNYLLAQRERARADDDGEHKLLAAHADLAVLVFGGYA